MEQLGLTLKYQQDGMNYTLTTQRLEAFCSTIYSIRVYPCSSVAHARI
jgi:hypothetical protein